MDFTRLRKAILPAAILLAGCGGGGVGSRNNLYEGTFAGTYSLNDGGNTGTVAGTVDTAGNVNFTLTQTSDGQTETVTGTVKNNGDFKGQVLSGGSTIGIAGNFDLITRTLTATLSENGVGTVQITATEG